jgi:hypothetical protein
MAKCGEAVYPCGDMCDSMHKAGATVPPPDGGVVKNLAFPWSFLFAGGFLCSAFTGVSWLRIRVVAASVRGDAFARGKSLT